MGKNIELEQLVINKLTQAQYDALAVKNPGELYFITDANPTKEVETQLAELSEKVPEPISTYESFPEATAENVGTRVVYTGETIEAPYIQNENGSISTVFLDPYLTRGHTFMLVPVQVSTSDTESITIYMWQDVIGAIPPFDYDMAGQVLSTNGMGYEWTELPEAGITKEEADQTYLPLSGGTMTGPLQMNIVGDKNTCLVVERQLNDSSPVYSWNIEFSRSTPAIYLKSNYGTPCVFFNDSIIPGSFSAKFGSSASKWSKIYALTLNNGEDLIVPTEGGTLARLEDVPESTQVETMPEASVDNIGKVLQYIGETNETYTNGHFYKCAENITITLSMMSSFVSSDSSATLDSEKFASQNPIFADADTSNTPYPAWRADYQEDGTWKVWTQTPNLSITTDELASVWGITISGTPAVGDMIAVMKQEEATSAWTEVVLGEKLPDQTDSAGKFLTTDGTDTLWSDKPLVNNAKNNETNTLNIVGNTSTQESLTDSVIIGYGAQPFGGVSGNGATIIGKGARGQSNSTAVGSTAEAKSFSSAFGYGAEAGAHYAVGLGMFARAKAQNAIQIGTSSGSPTINSDANTFKVANANGNFEIMSADGTIPAERYTTTPATAGTYIPKLTIAEDGTATREWSTESGGESLPNQTNNAGKFLMTDGTTASWSDKPLVNTTTQTQNSLVFGGAIGARDGKDIVIGQNSVGATADSGGVIIGHNINGGKYFSGVAIVSRGYYVPDTALMAGGAVVIGKQCTNTSGRVGGVVIGDSCSIKTNGAYSIVIGSSNTVTADYAIQLGGNNVTNSDANTFKVGNNNGNFEIMDAQGNIPLDRLTYVTDQIGDISAVLDSINGETLEG